MNGFIYLHRTLLDNPVFEDAEVLKIWIWCLLKASWTDREHLIGNQLVKLKRGQFVSGRGKNSLELNVSENKFYRTMKLLEKLQMIEQKANNKYTVVTIVNWALYQNHEQQSEQQMNNKRTTNEQQIDTNNKDNNIYKGNKDNLYVQKFDLFYSKYPKKQNKQAAKKSFLKIKPDDDLFNKMMDALENFKTSDDWTRDNGKFIPMPSTWLNNKRWEDELDVEIKQSETYKPEEDDEPQFESEEQRQQQIEFMSRLLRGGGIEL